MRWFRGSRLRFVLPGAFALATVILGYLLRHPYPALGGGLFLKMGETIAANGYALPARIPGYTGDGIPYAYPPLAAYLMAVLLDAGVDPLAIARWLPPALLFATVPCYYLFAEAVLDLRAASARAGASDEPAGAGTGTEGSRTATRLQAAIATVVFVTTPAVLQYTLTAGGTIRAGALLVTAAGLCVGVRLFGRREYRLTLPAAALFGVALLVHLKYALCFAVSYLFLYVYLDRTARGLLRGLAVAFGGFALAAPWWLRVGTTHGFDVFLRAGGTHGGIGTALWPIDLLTPEANPPSLWPALVVVAGLFLLVRGEYFLPLWTAIVGFVVGNDEHAVLIGALMVPVLLRTAVRRSVAPGRRSVGVEARGARADGRTDPAGASKSPASRLRTGLAALRDRAGGRGGGRPDGGESEGDGGFGAAPTAAVILLLVGYGVGAAAVYAGDTERLPSYIDGDDVEAAEWIRSETPADASFVVIGDAAEWFPLLADRTSLVAARGSEWDGAVPYERQRQLRADLSECLSAACVSETLAGAGLSPDYIYLPRDGYVEPIHRTLAPLRWSLLRTDFERSQEYEVVYRNDEVAVVRVDDPPGLTPGGASATGSTPDGR